MGLSSESSESVMDRLYHHDDNTLYNPTKNSRRKEYGTYFDWITQIILFSKQL